VQQYFSSAATKVCQYCSSTVAVVAPLEALGCWLPGSEFSGQHYPELAASLPGSPLQAELSHLDTAQISRNYLVAFGCGGVKVAKGAEHDDGWVCCMTSQKQMGQL